MQEIEAPQDSPRSEDDSPSSFIKYWRTHLAKDRLLFQKEDEEFTQKLIDSVSKNKTKTFSSVEAKSPQIHEQIHLFK